MQRYLITGASGGIGGAIAEALAAPDRELVLQGRGATALDAVCASVEQRGATATPLRFDLSRSEGVLDLCEALGDRIFDVVVNNAGQTVVKSVEAISLDDWQSALSVGVTAPFLLLQKVLPRMRSGSVVVNVLSVAARQGFPGWASYCATKHALDGFAKALREELRPRGIRVISVYPSATDTPLWDGVPGEWPRERMLPPEQVAATVRFVLERPAEVLVDEISIGHASGTL